MIPALLNMTAAGVGMVKEAMTTPTGPGKTMDSNNLQAGGGMGNDVSGLKIVQESLHKLSSFGMLQQKQNESKGSKI